MLAEESVVVDPREKLGQSRGGQVAPEGGEELQKQRGLTREGQGLSRRVNLVGFRLAKLLTVVHEISQTLLDLWIVQKYACLDLSQEKVVAELDLLEAGGLLQLGREGSHLRIQHICHQIILQTVNQKSHVSSSLVLCLDTASLMAGPASKHCL